MDMEEKKAAAKKKSAHKAVILKLKTHVFYFDKDNNPIKKGSLKKGKILRVDTKDFKQVNGKKLYRILNVGHDNVYAVCSTKNCERLNPKHIKNLAKAYLKKKKKLSPAEVRVNLPNATILMAKKINADLNKISGDKNSLCYYEDDAFSNDDGFCFKKDFAEDDLSFKKGGIDELYEDEGDTPNKVRFSPLRKVRGTGEGLGFNY